MRLAMKFPIFRSGNRFPHELVRFTGSVGEEDSNLPSVFRRC